jgi:DNA-binding NarL/FixJ family response regulator
MHVDPADDAAIISQTQIQPLSSEIDISTHRCRVIVADDNGAIRRILIQVLQESQELEVIGEAEDGRQAVELTFLLRPDVVIMDLDMPRMNGIQATRKISRILPEVLVIGFSMYMQEEIEAAMRAAGAVGYICKGSPIEELLAAMLIDHTESKQAT